MIRELLPRLTRGERLTREETGAAVRAMMRGEAPDEEIKAFLLALAGRGETAAELLGGAEALRAEAVPFPSARQPLLDTCGTGGDGSYTYNISTAVAFVPSPLPSTGTGRSRAGREARTSWKRWARPSSSARKAPRAPSKRLDSRS